MTASEILALEPGPEMDAAVALSLGWTRYIEGWTRYIDMHRTSFHASAFLDEWRRPDGEQSRLFRWSTDPSAAVLLLVEADKLGWYIEIIEIKSGPEWSVLFSHGPQLRFDSDAKADTFALAVCRAWLLAKTRER